MINTVCGTSKIDDQMSAPGLLYFIRALTGWSQWKKSTISPCSFAFSNDCTWDNTSLEKLYMVILSSTRRSGDC